MRIAGIGREFLRLGCAVLAPLVLAAPTSEAVTLYVVTPLSRDSSQARAINDAGQVVGFENQRSGGRAFVQGDGSWQYLGTLGGTSSLPAGINNSGDIVGASTVADGSNHPFVYRDGSMIDLGTLGGSTGGALGINAHGWIIGFAAVPETHPGDLTEHAFLYRDGVMVAIGSGQWSTYASAINDSGQVVGWRTGITRAFLYDQGVMTLLGTLGGYDSVAYDINSAGQVVGHSTTAYPNYYRHAFLYEDGVMSDLGAPPGRQSAAWAVNDRGQVVGSMWPIGGERGFLWEDGVMYDLNDLIEPGSDYFVRTAHDINESGQIAATGCRSNGLCRALRLDPIPEPATGALFGGGLAFMAWLRRRGGAFDREGRRSRAAPRTS